MESKCSYETLQTCRINHNLCISQILVDFKLKKCFDLCGFGEIKKYKKSTKYLLNVY